jgi:hypothetical protein
MYYLDSNGNVYGKTSRENYEHIRRKKHRKHCICKLLIFLLVIYLVYLYMKKNNLISL